MAGDVLSRIRIRHSAHRAMVTKRGRCAVCGLVSKKFQIYRRYNENKVRRFARYYRFTTAEKILLGSYMWSYLGYNIKKNLIFLGNFSVT